MDWQPKEGTLPGRTEMRVLQAMLSLEQAGASAAHLGAIYGFVDSRGYAPCSSTDERWQLRTWMADRGWQPGFDDHHDELVFFKNPGLPYMMTYTYDRALKMALEHGFEVAWHPHESTVDKRLKNLRNRGLVDKVAPAVWTMTDDGRYLAKRARLWAS